MKLVAIKESFWTLCRSVDNEVLEKNRRPYVLIIRLKYSFKNYDFAIPVRSNIPHNEQKYLYFPLPPRKTTKSGNKHGLHFKKMIPINKSLIEKYYISNENSFDNMIQNKISKDIKDIVEQAQSYLQKYENGEKVLYATDIGKLLILLNDTMKEN